MSNKKLEWAEKSAGQIESPLEIWPEEDADAGFSPASAPCEQTLFHLLVFIVVEFQIWR